MPIVTTEKQLGEGVVSYACKCKKKIIFYPHPEEASRPERLETCFECVHDMKNLLEYFDGEGRQKR